jgi:hypothetical protein
MNDNKTQTMNTDRTPFHVSMSHFDKAHRLMHEFPKMPLIVELGDMERVVLQQEKKPNQYIKLDRLSPARRNERIVLKIELEDGYTDCTINRDGTIHPEEKVVIKSFIAINDSDSSVTELVEINDRLHARVLRNGEKKDLARAISNAVLCQVD